MEEKVIQIPASAKNTADLTGLTFTKNFRGFGNYNGHIKYFDKERQKYLCHLVYAANSSGSETDEFELYEYYTHKRLMSMGCIRLVKEQRWADGTSVYCKWNGDGKWWPAVIVNMKTNGTYIVRYEEDNATDNDVDPNCITSRFEHKKWKLLHPFGKKQVRLFCTSDAHELIVLPLATSLYHFLQTCRYVPGQIKCGETWKYIPPKEEAQQ